MYDPPAACHNLAGKGETRYGLAAPIRGFSGQANSLGACRPFNRYWVEVHQGLHNAGVRISMQYSHTPECT